MTRTLAIIPARAGSKRILNKNRRDFLGKPLILWTVEFALSVDFFDHILSPLIRLRLLTLYGC